MDVGNDLERVLGEEAISPDVDDAIPRFPKHIAAEHAKLR